MSNLLDNADAVLSQAGYDVQRSARSPDLLLFENDSVLGFLFGYPTVSNLMGSWASDADAIAAERRFQLRAAGQKAWNVYLVLLAEHSTTYAEVVALSLIEEDLSGMRKIARGNVSNSIAVREALLPLIAIQARPELPPVDMPAEIRLRTTELPQEAVDAFLSSAPDAVIAQSLEELP